MNRSFPSVAILFATMLPAFSLFAADDKKEAPGLGDPGKLQSISIESGVGEKVTISGRDTGHQLIVTGHYDSGQLRDLSRQVTYSSDPAGLVDIDDGGYLTGIKEGVTNIHVKSKEGLDVVVNVTVSEIANDRPINFGNEVVPVFTKYGCNSGSCHGKSGGQNGFALSLLGFEPPEDFEYLVKEARGRRLFLAAPERSLLLLKSIAELPHGGGHRIEKGSPGYNLMRRWIEQGVPYGSGDAAKVARIEVLPKERLMQREGTQQLSVIAHYTDGRMADVTRMTRFDSNDTEMADVSVTGVVTTARLTGSVAVMARYQGFSGVFRATVPLGIPVDNLPPSKNFVDEIVFKKLTELGLPASKIADDATFFRRVSIDLAGRLPTREESEKFLSDQDPDKRAKAIEGLLSSIDHAGYFANKWAAILRNKRRKAEDRPATFGFHDWIRQSFYDNKPYDEFVREIVAASGRPDRNPAVAWYREVKDQSAQVEDTAQLFLGLRIQCARCHHHPFEVWSQQDYYGFAAFFAQVGRKKSSNPAFDRVHHRRGVAQATNPKTKQAVRPTGLGSPALEIAPDDDPRQHLADWLSDPANPFFARALVNRYWKHFFGRGLVDPEDDMRVTNPATNPELLDRLASDFIESGFDLRHLCRTICNSNVYQLSSEPNEWNRDDKQNFSRYYPKRLNAEVLLDAIDQVTGAPTNFGGVPAGTRATHLPDNGFSSYFLTVFGKPESSSACECERSSEANLAQSLHLLNSSEIQGKLTNGSGSAARLTNDKERGDEAKVRELYLLAFSREPTSEEVNIATGHVKKTGEAKRAYEDIVWALINTKEFLFNH
ncbi:MAG: DUF1549 and DUF1553 domain-containing protein [Pirellulaceae bacterium]|jgi:hypothetical protein|nr:DUF1549 and DUF1553 domain-containing protein [Pirellulaceae bacterium]